MTSATIAPATPADLAAIHALLRASELTLDGFDAHLATTLAARHGERVVGCAAIEPYDGTALLRSVAVASDHRGSGLGARLTRAALDLAHARGARTVYLLTTTAGDYFPRFGFRPVARDAVDEAVRGSVEFTTACPASALAMALDLSL
jgi:amino-acid N-acetyltransferase